MWRELNRKFLGKTYNQCIERQPAHYENYHYGDHHLDHLEKKESNEMGSSEEIISGECMWLRINI